MAVELQLSEFFIVRTASCFFRMLLSKPRGEIMFLAFETERKYEEQNECCPMQLLLFKKPKNLAAKKVVASI